MKVTFASRPPTIAAGYFEAQESSDGGSAARPFVFISRAQNSAEQEEPVSSKARTTTDSSRLVAIS